MNLDRFLLNDFKSCTLFPKFFSSFLRSTCSLSDSHSYLALEDAYLPFKAAFPNNPTLRRLPFGQLVPHGAVTLYGVPLRGTLTPFDLGPPLEFTTRTA